ncbi:MAG TPA: glycoside hydrolase family 38 C-terminal domain-containing protein [Pseudothermotoga sp.]|nr:glycoside hydrolase family 38 C-terminal domain-containing protein [Pseudothermotoga sp.]HOK84021.1 glycoside hydrolase family 38 C-terminal domain-containing protein [Pseudothermotoga sp.]HPP70487.1 glycoside hydrolase family 38 C-terminal domain-containing protein [Pseudothermotoga sp.]
MKQVYVVTHTHWDREWYATFEIFRERLTLLLEKLVSQMKKDDSFMHFHLDGQTIVLEDFQETMGMKQDLLDLIRNERISVGPWYVLPDEFLITAESWIRNYLYSERIAKNFGIKLCGIGYLPDMFGHNAYMPAVVKGLGLRWAVVWRGVDGISDTTFLWLTPFEDAVNVIYLIHSYSNAAHFGADEQSLKRRFTEEASRLSQIAPHTPPLLMNGTDHEIPYLNIGNILKEISTNEVKFIHTGFEQYAAKLEKPQVRVVGELRSPRTVPVLKDVTSARIWEKILHHQAEKFYIHYLEPILSISRLMGNQLPSESLWYGWRKILQCQPHDSICGCSIDAVHRAVQVRLKDAIDHGKALFARTFLELVEGRTGDMGITVFNPLENEFKGVVEAYVNLREGEYQFTDEEGNQIEAVMLECEKDFERDMSTFVRFYESDTTKAIENDQRKTYRCFLNLSVPSFGFRSLKIIPSATRTSSFMPTHQINENGTLSLKHEGRTFENLCYLEDVEDVGDEYNYSWSCKEIFTSLQTRAVVYQSCESAFMRKTIAKNTMQIPKSIAESRKNRSQELVDLPFEMEYTFYRDLPRIDVKIRFINCAKDHRLSVVFPFKNLSELVTDGYFGPVKHKIEKLSGDYSKWAELPENNFAMYWFATIPQIGITISTKGLREVRVEDDGLKITLLRSVEWLSRDDLITRPGHAGPGIRTCEAQGIGEHVAEFSIVLHKKWNIEDVYRHVRNYQIPPIAIQGEFKNLPKIELSVEKGFLSAFKPSEDGKGVIVRAFDPRGGKPEITYQPGEMIEVNLAERPVQDQDRLKNVRSWLITNSVVQ